MSGTGPISAAPPPADSSSGLDGHHSGQTQVVTTVAVPHVQIRRVKRTNRPSARRLWAPREPRRLVIGADSKKGCYMEGAYTAAAGLLGRGRGLASLETHHPPHPSLAQIFQQCIPRAPSLDFRSGL